MDTFRALVITRDETTKAQSVGVKTLTLADLLPAAVNQRAKMGFGVPLGTWFRGELRDYMRDLLLAPDARYRAMLSPAYVESLVARHLAGDANFGHQLWSLLSFEQWLRLLPEWTHSTREPAALAR